MVVESGLVKLSARLASGQEAVIAVLGPGELLGEVGALDGGARAGAAVALEDLTASVVAVADLRALVHEDASVAREVMTTLSDRLRDADRKRFELIAFDTQTRVAARLVELSARFGERAGEEVHVGLPLSQAELAGWIGASQGALCTVLQRLRRQGLIETGRRSITVLDADGLARCATAA